MATLNFNNGCAAPSHLGSLRRRHLCTSPRLLSGQCRFPGVVWLSVPWIRMRSHVRHVESKLGVSDWAPEGTSEEVWCGLCGDRGGWLMCGRCLGEGGFPTRPGLAGVKGKVGWGRCKTCFGQTVVPCLLCGISEVSEWKLWVEHARRHPHRILKHINIP